MQECSMKILPGVVLLAAFSPRSRAYVQALMAAGLAPEHVLTFGAPERDQPLNLPVAESAELFLPDLTTPLGILLEQAGWAVSHCAESDVNDPAVATALGTLSAKVVIYSGYGGQLVRQPLFSLGIPLLHMHAGWLPRYRGSTTTYYSWLERNECGVSAILLSAGIDEGPLIARRLFPPPPPGIDVDHVYDGAMRAAVLVDVMTHFDEAGDLPSPSIQPDAGTTYFVIHPVLKHLALLRNATPAQ